MSHTPQKKRKKPTNILLISKCSHCNLPPEKLSFPSPGCLLSATAATPMLWNTRLGYPCWQTWLEMSMVWLFFMFRLQLLTNILEQYIPQDDDALGEVAFPFICSKFTKQ